MNLNYSNNLGCIIFGYRSGFEIFYIDGCCKDLTEDHSKKLIQAISLELESTDLSNVNHVLCYSKLFLSPDLYTFFIKYLPSKDITGRNAYKAVAIVLKNAKLATHELLSNLESLVKILTSNESFEDSIDFTDYLLTSTLTLCSLEDRPSYISSNQRFLIIPSQKETKFLETASFSNFYKVFAASDKFTTESEIKLIDEDFLHRPDKSYDMSHFPDNQQVIDSKHQNYQPAPDKNYSINKVNDEDNHLMLKLCSLLEETLQQNQKTLDNREIIHKSNLIKSKLKNLESQIEIISFELKQLIELNQYLEKSILNLDSVKFFPYTEEEAKQKRYSFKTLSTFIKKHSFVLGILMILIIVALFTLNILKILVIYYFQ